MNTLLLKYPASWWKGQWREALPSGNGTIAAAVYGAVQDETILLTHEKLWHGVVTEQLPDISDRLDKVRNLLDEKAFFEADRVMADALKESGYAPQIGTPLPLADLKVRTPVNSGFQNYRRDLNMETGEVSVSWKDAGTDYSRRLFVSRTDNMVVMEICSSASVMDFQITLERHTFRDISSPNDTFRHVPLNITTEADAAGWIRYAGRNDDGTDFGAVARVIPTSQENSPAGFKAVEGRLHVNSSRSALVLVKLFVRGEREAAWASLKQELHEQDVDYETLLARHTEEHRTLFDRLTLDLGGSEADHQLSNEELLLDAYQGTASTALVEKMWAFGRYLLISSSRPGSLPCPLMGKWCGEYHGFWAFHMANENLQMIYWQALSGNLTETALPVFDYFDKKLGDFRENARKLFGCRGIYVPCVTTPPSGLLKDIQPHTIHWTGAAAWVGQLYFDYFRYTGDLDFLRERAMPFLRETASFYDDFFTLDEEGFFKSSPSNSPENTPGNFYEGSGMGSRMETTINATMDFALAKEVLTHLVEGGKLIGSDQDELKKWEEMIQKIPPYQVNDDGAVMEWMHPYFPDNYHHRHQSHIYPLFPGLEVNSRSDLRLFEAFKTAIQKRLEIGISEQTGWSLAHMTNVYARLKEGDQALECLNLLARSCVMNNLYTTHNDWRSMGIGVEMEWAPYQIDANMGWTAAIQEMLLFSLPGRMEILPALPKAWSKGSIKGLLARGGIEVSIRWDIDEDLIEAELLSLGKDQEIELGFPESPSRFLHLENGVKQVLRR
ncbi:glycosyl hydrolase family 95 catalytic domain-containing protein [Oceanipulchritudo coccoides]|nr:glycoside hydrolase N-terminal domain-containing protein [Oceanipulchritudo coccoides]